MKLLTALLLVLLVCTLAASSDFLNQNLQLAAKEIDTEEDGELTKFGSSFSVQMQPFSASSAFRHPHPSIISGPLPKSFSRLPPLRSLIEAAQNPRPNTQTFREPLFGLVMPSDSVYPSPALNDLTTADLVTDTSSIRRRETEAAQALLMLNCTPQREETNFYFSPNPRNVRSTVHPYMVSPIAAKSRPVPANNIRSNYHSSNQSVGTAMPLYGPLSRSFSDSQPTSLQQQRHTTDAKETRLVFADTPLNVTQSSSSRPVDSRVIRRIDSSMPSALHIGPQHYTGPTLLQSPDTPDGTTFNHPLNRVTWFGKVKSTHHFFQDTMPEDPLPVGFSQRHYYGTVKPRLRNVLMSCDAGLMGYKIAYNRMLFLDGYKMRNPVKGPPGKDWQSRDLDKETLKFETFKSLYRLEKDGLVVVLRGRNQLIMASYGLPPLGAILLRSDGTHLLPIARSIDHMIESCKVNNGDVVIVGPLDLIRQLELKTLQLASKDLPETTLTKIQPLVGKSICVVAPIFVRQ